MNKGGALVRDVILLTDATDIKEAPKELAEVDQFAAQSLENVRISCHSWGELALLKKIDDITPKYNEARSIV